MEVEPNDSGEVASAAATVAQQEPDSSVTDRKKVSESSEEGRPFICGVVEGFYNRPWTQNQRVDLYKKLNTFGLNAYLYGKPCKIHSRSTCLSVSLLRNLKYFTSPYHF